MSAVTDLQDLDATMGAASIEAILNTAERLHRFADPTLIVVYAHAGVSETRQAISRLGYLPYLPPDPRGVGAYAKWLVDPPSSPS